MFGSGKHYSMEEQQGRRNVNGERELEGGQPSRNSGQTGLEPEEHRIDIVEISPRVKNWIESLKKAEESTQSQSQWRRITKVPQLLRGTQDFKKLYEPRVISIGPYHHGKPHLHPVQMIKPLCARNFLADSNQEIEALYTKIESNIEAVRKCYNKRPTIKYDNEALAWMMLLDGCSLLQFIRRKDLRKFLREHHINFVMQDLFLLENQLPFGVLKLIFEGAKFNDGLTMEEMIKKFVTDNGRLEESTLEIHLEEASHILGLLRSALLGQSQPEQERPPDKKKSRRRLKEYVGGSVAHVKKANNEAFGSLFETSRSLKLPGSISNQVERDS
ncbi:UPF0481 protein At3g47200-like [Vitis riparia]|uniref:UPF0481 protein At3g47200-like n=1 Tax=Vitis riparia TaxID=96939 RepID=UPI00155B2FBC|nr:UPF0481 protein At3g47200-like [Vitis riparia]